MQTLLTKRKLSSLGIIFLLLLFAIIVNSRMIRYGLNGAIDLEWHLTWLQHFSKQFYEGIFYPRWLAGTNFGYGSPTFVFYPPLIYYLGSLLKGLGFNAEQAMIILFTFAIFLGGLFSYLYCSNYFRKSISIMGALLFMSSPITTNAVYAIGTISTTFGIALVPLIFYTTDQANKDPKWRLGLALSWTILALTHLPTLLLISMVWPLYILLFVLNLESKNYKNIIFIVLYSLIGLGIASFFLLPAITEKSLVDIEYMKKVAGSFEKLMIGAERIPIFPIPKLFERDFYIFIVRQYYHTLLVLILGTLLLFFRKQFKDWKTILKWFILIVLISFLMTHAAWFLWRLSDTLQTIQFPTRLLTLLVFFTVCLTCDILHKLSLNKKFKLLYYGIWVLMIIIMLSNVRLINLAAKRYPSLHSPGNPNLEHLNFLKQIINNPYADNLRDVGEYRPLNSEGHSPGKPQKGQPKVSILMGKAEIDIQDWRSYERNIHIDAIEPSKIRIRTYHYPAWQLFINGKPVAIEVLEDSTIGINLLPGDYQIQLVYGWTQYFIIGIILSILSIATLIIVIWFESKFNRILNLQSHSIQRIDTQ